MKFPAFIIAIVTMIPIFVSANAIINEIAWMGTEASATDEWIELYNSGSEMSDLQGLTLGAADGQPNITLSGEIPAGGYFLLERSDDDTVPGIAADLIYTGALGNSGEKLELKNMAGGIVDSVDAIAGWPAGDNTTKETMQRLSAGSWTTGAGTPRAANVTTINQESGSMNQAGTQTNSASSSMIHDSSFMIQEPKRFFTVDAGDDVITVAGAEVRFSGAAHGFDGKPLDETNGNVRYLWNFGDGAFFEARNTNHIYRYPGVYRAALYVSSGQTSGSDVIGVMVGEGNVIISELAGAWIEIHNEGTATVDLSSWQIRSDASAYAISARTTIGPGAFIIFSRETTGLLFGPLNPKAELRYANGTLADNLSFTGTLLPEKSIIRDSEGNAIMGELTPGRENKVYQVASSRYHGNIQNTKKESASASSTDAVFVTNVEQEKSVNEKENPMIHNTSYKLPAKIGSPIFASNYFWLAVSISMGLLAGAVVLWLRTMVLF